MRSWTPRRPSKGLEARIFATPHGPAQVAAAEPPIRLNWLAPAMAALVLLCVLFNQRFSSNTFAESGGTAMTAMILSNQSSAAYLPGSFQGDRNTIPADAFEFTNANAGASRVAAPPRARTTD